MGLKPNPILELNIDPISDPYLMCKFIKFFIVLYKDISKQDIHTTLVWISVGRFFFSMQQFLVPILPLYLLGGPLGEVLNQVLLIKKKIGFVLSMLFQIQELLGIVQNWV